MNLICLHYNSNDTEFFINPACIEYMEWLPNAQRSTVTMTSGTSHKCAETPDQIQALVQQAAPRAYERVVGGVGGQGPVYGDGADVETRGGKDDHSSGDGGSDDVADPKLHGLAQDPNEIPAWIRLGGDD